MNELFDPPIIEGIVIFLIWLFGMVCLGAVVYSALQLDKEVEARDQEIVTKNQEIARLKNELRKKDND